jgi:hypothetical protein
LLTLLTLLLVFWMFVLAPLHAAAREPINSKVQAPSAEVAMITNLSRRVFLASRKSRRPKGRRLAA